MGNLFDTDIRRIYRSLRWWRFRRRRMDECALCPMNLHTGVTQRRRIRTTA